MSEAAVELCDVFCVHRTAEGDAAALQGLDLEVRLGEIACVLGPSGAGKSTLLRVIAGLQQPSIGSVKVFARDISRLRPREREAYRHRELSLITQSSRDLLAPALTARQAVMLPLALRGISRHRRRARAESLLDAVALADRSRARPQELSGGERQRLAMCVALAHAPRLLLADEPTGELDRESAAVAYSMFVSLVRTANATAIVASHDPLAAAHADRTIGLRDGRVVEEHAEGTFRLVVGRGGWVRLPTDRRARIRPGDRIYARPADDGVLLTPAVRRPAPYGPTPPAHPAPDPHFRWEPASVDLKEVRRTYGQPGSTRAVLDGLSYSFTPGKFTVITGRSGSGKTTLLRLLAGLDRADDGDVVIGGRRLSDRGGEELAALRRRLIGFMGQDPRPITFLSCYENVLLTLRIRGWNERDAGSRAAAMLGLVGLAERTHQRASRLSAGEVQRLALARALAGAQGLLLADEPTSRLDGASVESVAKLLVQTASTEGQTIICASHDPVVIGAADETLVLEGWG